MPENDDDDDLIFTELQSSEMEVPDFEEAEPEVEEMEEEMDEEEEEEEAEPLSAFDEGNYVALVDLNDFLGSDPVDIPAAELLLSQPLQRNQSFFNLHPSVPRTFDPAFNEGASLVELPSGSNEDSVASEVLDERFLLKPKRGNPRLAEAQNAAGPTGPTEIDMATMAEELKKLENFQLPGLLKDEMEKEVVTPNEEKARFARDLMLSTFASLKKK